MFIDKPILKERAEAVEKLQRSIDKGYQSQSHKTTSTVQHDISRYSAVSSLQEPPGLNTAQKDTGSIHTEPRNQNVTQNTQMIEARLDSELKGQINQHQSLDNQRQQKSENRSNKKQKKSHPYEHSNSNSLGEHDLPRQAKQLSSKSKKSERNVQRKLQGSQLTESGPRNKRDLPSQSKMAVSKFDSDKNKQELIRQFGHEKGQEYYGAIRELEEFLDPNVLKDQEFQMNQETKQELSFVEGNVDAPAVNRVEQTQPTTDMLMESSHATKIAGSQRYHDSILGPMNSSEIQYNTNQNLQASSGYASRTDNILDAGHVRKNQRKNGKKNDPYQNHSQDDKIASYGYLQSNEQLSQQHRLNQRSQDNNEMDNSHSDTVGMGSISAFQGGNLQNYVNMEIGPPTSLDHFYPNPIPQQFKNPLALAPIKPKKGSKSKGKQQIRHRAGHSQTSQTYDETQIVKIRAMQTQGGRRLMEHTHTQGSPRSRALALQAYGQAHGLKETKNQYFEQNNRVGTHKVSQRNNAHQLIYDQQRSYMINPISQSTGIELNQQASWNSRFQDDQQVYKKLQEQRASNQSTSQVNGMINNSQGSIQANVPKNIEKYPSNNLSNQNQANETLPVISHRQHQNESRNQQLDQGIFKPQSVYKEVRQISETTGRKMNGSTTPTTLARMGTFNNDSHLTPMAQKAIYRPIHQNMSFQNNNERRFQSSGREGMYVKKGGFYLNQPSSGTGKIILKKINHYFDNKKINKLYRNQSRRRGDQWRTEAVNRNLQRNFPNDIGNVDLSKVRRESGFDSTDRKESANGQRHTDRSNRSRMQSGLYNKSVKQTTQDADQKQFQQTPRSPIKKNNQRIQSKVAGQKVSNTGRYQKEQGHEHMTTNITLGPNLLRQSYNQAQDRLASQELPEQNINPIHRIPQTQQIKKRATVGAEEMKIAMRECGTPEIIDIIENDKHQSLVQGVDGLSHDYAQSQSQTDGQVHDSRNFVKRRTSEPPNVLYDKKNRIQKLNNVTQGMGNIEYGHQPENLNYTLNNISQDQQVNISIRNRVQYQMQKRPTPKASKKNLLYRTEMGNHMSSTRNKALQNAQKQTMKRPFYQHDINATMPNLQSASQYSQTLPRQVPTVQNTKRAQRISQNMSKKSRLGDTQQILHNNAKQFEIHHSQSQYQSQSRMTNIQNDSVSSKNYELAQFKQKKAGKSKRKSSKQGSRNRSRSPKRDSKSKGDITRSVPNNTALNRLVQQKGPNQSSKGAKATIDAEFYNRRSQSRSRTGDKQLVANRSFNVAPNMLQSERSNPNDRNSKKAIMTMTRNASRLSASKHHKKKDSTSMPPDAGSNVSTFNAGDSKLKSIMREPGERSRPSLKQKTDYGYRNGPFPAKVSLPSNSSISKMLAPHQTLNKSNKSKHSQSRPDTPGSEFSQQNSDVITEVNKSLKRQNQSHRKMKNLDQENLNKIKSPSGARNQSLYVPEGLAADPKMALDMISVGTKKTSQKDSMYPMRTNSAQEQMRKGLNYRFSLKDLGKYSQKLRYKDINWKLKLTALGKVIPDMKTRKKILMKGSHFNNLLKNLKGTDWGQTPIYHQYLRNGRWKHEDDNIYSEIELQYYISYLNQIDNAEKELQPEDVKVILDKYYKKTMHTLEVLMNQMNMQYYLEKVRLMFADVEPTVSQLAKIMSRCMKMYQQMDQFIRIFKLIDKNNKKIIQGKKDQTLIKRLIVTIKLLLKEHPVLPVSFVFKGQDLLEQLRKEQAEMGEKDGVQDEEDPFPSPIKQRSKSRKKRDNTELEKDESMNKTFNSMNSKDIKAAISPDMREYSRILDTESVADSLMAGM